MNSNILFDKNQKLVYHIIKRYFNVTKNSDKFDDFSQVGFIGLLKASKRFDVNKGFKFTTYAAQMIIGEVQRYARDYENNYIHMSRDIKVYLNKYSYLLEIGLTDIEIIHQLNITTDKLNIIKNAYNSRILVRLDKHIYNEDITNGDSIINTLHSEYNTENEGIQTLYFSEALNYIKGSLNPNQIKILDLLTNEKTQEVISELVGTTQATVSRTMKRIRNIYSKYKLLTEAV